MSDTAEAQTPENDAHREYVGSLCQTCGDGSYALTEQGVECGTCAGVAGLAGALPPIPPSVIPPEVTP